MRCCCFFEGAVRKSDQSGIKADKQKHERKVPKLPSETPLTVFFLPSPPAEQQERRPLGGAAVTLKWNAEI